jgi:hypothetical protein
MNVHESTTVPALNSQHRSEASSESWVNIHVDGLSAVKTDLLFDQVSNRFSVTVQNMPTGGKFAIAPIVGG